MIRARVPSGGSALSSQILSVRSPLLHGYARLCWLSVGLLSRRLTTRSASLLLPSSPTNAQQRRWIEKIRGTGATAYLPCFSGAAPADGSFPRQKRPAGDRRKPKRHPQLVKPLGLMRPASPMLPLLLSPPLPSLVTGKIEKAADPPALPPSRTARVKLSNDLPLFHMAVNHLRFYERARRHKHTWDTYMVPKNPMEYRVPNLTGTRTPFSARVRGACPTRAAVVTRVFSSSCRFRCSHGSPFALTT